MKIFKNKNDHNYLIMKIILIKSKNQLIKVFNIQLVEKLLHLMNLIKILLKILVDFFY